MIYVYISLIIGLAALFWVLNSRRRQQVPVILKTPPPPSIKDNLILIILRKAPAKIDAPLIEAAANRAWAKRFGINKNATAYIERGVPGVMFVLQAHGNAVMVIGGEKSNRKMQQPTKFQLESAAGLWERYSHDLSVSLIHNLDKDQTKLRLYVARLTAALCDKDSLAVFHPPTGRLWKLDRPLVEKLARDPESFFSTSVQHKH